MANQTIGPNRPKRPNTDRRRYDEFHETLVTPIPNRTYETRIETRVESASFPARTVRFLASILIVLLAIRFIINLFSLSRGGDWVSFFYLTTNWAVAPFQNLFGLSSLISPYGFIDWPAATAAAVTAIVAWAIWQTLKARPYD